MEGNATPETANPLVSIIINNYNYGRFLGDAIRSAVKQSYRHVEVIVVDDGSTDDSREVIASFPEVRTVFKENGGQASAYNAGFAASRGEIILFLDSDDFLARDAVEEAVRLFKPGVAKVHFYLRIVTGLGAEPTDIVIPNTLLSDGNVRDQIQKTGSYTAPPASGNLFARFALVNILPMPEASWKISSDTYPVYLAPLLGSVKSCEKVLGSYRIHGNNHEFEIPFDGRKLRHRMNYEALRDEALSKFFHDQGSFYPSGCFERQFNHLKARLASLLIDPEKHPYAGDRVGTLAVRFIGAIWRESGARWSKKVLTSLWMAALLAAPRRWRQKLIDMAFVPTSRPSALNRSIRLTQSEAL